MLRYYKRICFSRRYKMCMMLASVTAFIFTYSWLVQPSIDVMQPNVDVINLEIEIGNGNIDTSEYQLDEPELDEDFPVNKEMSEENTRIPRIIHQTWRDEYVPYEFTNNVMSFVDKNPNYRYYFWTDISGRKLIAERHPYLLKTFDNYAVSVRRADLLRYVVLYEFGGVYADLDTVCVRSLDRILHKFTCVLTPEPYEQSALLYNTEFLLTNSIMFCQAYHPFLKQLLEILPRYEYFADDIDASGPMVLTYQLHQYRAEKGSRRLPETHEHSVFVPSSQYFQNELDPSQFHGYRIKCRMFETLNAVQKKGCISLLRRGMVDRKRSRFIYTMHTFFHTKEHIVRREGKQTITRLVKHAELY